MVSTASEPMLTLNGVVIGFKDTSSIETPDMAQLVVSDEVARVPWAF